MIFACPHCHTKLADRSVRHCTVCRKPMTRHCPFCAEDISILATVCKYCGENAPPVTGKEMVPAAASAPARVEKVEAPVEVRRPAKADIEFVGNLKSVAWEDPAAGGWIRRSWKTWAASQFSPASFWQRTPADTGQVRAITYAWALRSQAAVTLGAVALIAVVGLVKTAPAAAPALLMGTAGLALLVPALFALTAADTWLRAGLWHLPLKLLGAKGNYQATVRSVAYNSGAQLWALLPVVGLLPALGLGFASDVCALREVHKMSGARVYIAAAIPVLTKVAIGAAAVAWAIHNPRSWQGC